MRVIHKHSLQHGINNVIMPEWATPISIGFQGNQLVMWEMHDADYNGAAIKPQTFNNIIVVNTGEPFEDEFEYVDYIGTATSEYGIVKHVFAVGNPYGL